MKKYFSSNKKIHQFYIKGYLIAKNSFVTEVTPISVIIDYYFIWSFFKIMGKNKKKLRTMFHFTDSCQEKSVNSQELFTYPSFGKFLGFFPYLF